MPAPKRRRVSPLPGFSDLANVYSGQYLASKVSAIRLFISYLLSVHDLNVSSDDASQDFINPSMHGKIPIEMFFSFISVITDSGDLHSGARSFNNGSLSADTIKNYLTSIAFWLTLSKLLITSPVTFFQLTFFTETACYQLAKSKSDPSKSRPATIESFERAVTDNFLVSLLLFWCIAGLRAASLTEILPSQVHRIILNGRKAYLVTVFENKTFSNVTKCIIIGCNCKKVGRFDGSFSWNAQYCLIHNAALSSVEDLFPIDRQRLNGIVKSLGITLHSPRRMCALGARILHEKDTAVFPLPARNTVGLWAAQSKESIHYSDDFAEWRQGIEPIGLQAIETRMRTELEVNKRKFKLDDVLNQWTR